MTQIFKQEESGTEEVSYGSDKDVWGWGVGIPKCGFYRHKIHVHTLQKYSVCELEN